MFGIGRIPDGFIRQLESSEKSLLYISVRYGLDNWSGEKNGDVGWQGIESCRKEFDLLFCLASHAGQVLSREQLYSLVWNNENAYDIDEAVKSQIKTLRKKLTAYNREYIKNVWGIGYRFVDECKK